MEFWAFVSTLYNKINENWRWRGFFSSSGGFIGMSFYEISEQGIEVAQMAIAGSNKIVLCEQVLLQSAARTVTAVQPPSSQYLQAALRNLGSTPPTTTRWIPAAILVYIVTAVTAPVSDEAHSCWPVTLLYSVTGFGWAEWVTDAAAQQCWATTALPGGSVGTRFHFIDLQLVVFFSIWTGSVVICTQPQAEELPLC